MALALLYLSLNEATVNLMHHFFTASFIQKTTDIHSPLCSNMTSNISRVWGSFASSALYSRLNYNQIVIMENLSSKLNHYTADKFTS